MAPHPYTYISVCAGAGGLDIGLELALPGARAVCYVEREIAAVEILVKGMREGYLADAPVWSDLKTFDCQPFRGRVAGVVGGIPCQGNSLAGNRRLEQDERNLWPDFWRLVRGVDARWFFLENVAGIAIPGSDGARAPAEGILEDIAEAGWSAEWTPVSAAQVGANHKRERWFMLAHCEGGNRGLQLQSGQSRQAGDESQWGNKVLDHPQRSQPRQGEQGDQGEAGQRRRGLADTGIDVADAGRQCDQRWGEHRILEGAEGAKPCQASKRQRDGNCVSDGGPNVADSWRQRPQGDSATGPAPWPTGRSGGTEIPLFAPGPGDLDEWRRILAIDPTLEPARHTDGVGIIAAARRLYRLVAPGRNRRERGKAASEAFKSALHRVPDGLAHRVDRLRLTGNGVVPLQAAVAFSVLRHRLNTKPRKDRQ